MICKTCFIHFSNKTILVFRISTSKACICENEKGEITFENTGVDAQTVEMTLNSIGLLIWSNIILQHKTSTTG